VQTFPASGGQWQVSTNGGYFVVWRGDGKELFYVSSDRKMMSVEVNGEGSSFERGTPKFLFDLHIPSFNTPQAQFAVTPDGQKFLIAKPVDEDTSAPITVVLNWTSDLKR